MSIKLFIEDYKEELKEKDFPKIPKNEKNLIYAFILEFVIFLLISINYHSNFALFLIIGMVIILVEFFIFRVAELHSKKYREIRLKYMREVSYIRKLTLFSLLKKYKIAVNDIETLKILIEEIEKIKINKNFFELLKSIFVDKKDFLGGMISAVFIIAFKDDMEKLSFRELGYLIIIILIVAFIYFIYKISLEIFLEKHSNLIYDLKQAIIFNKDFQELENNMTEENN